jgi:hypothetical protein
VLLIVQLSVPPPTLTCARATVRLQTSKMKAIKRESFRSDRGVDFIGHISCGTLVMIR